MDNKLIGDYIRIYREKKGLSQAQLAEMVNVTSKMISRYERGDKLPGRDVLFELALALNFSIDEMIQNSAASVQHNEISELLNRLPIEKRNTASKMFVEIIRILSED